MARVQEMCDNGLCIQDGSVVSFPARLAFGVMKGFSYRVKVRVRSDCFLQRSSRRKARVPPERAI